MTVASHFKDMRSAVIAFPVGYTEVRVHFSEAIEHGSATDKSNYRLASGLSIMSASVYGAGEEEAESPADAGGGPTVVTLTTDVMNGDLMYIDVLHVEGISRRAGAPYDALASRPFVSGIASIPQLQKPREPGFPFSSSFHGLIATASCQKDGGVNSSRLIDTLGFSFLHVERGGPYNSLKVIGQKHVPGIVEEVERLRPQGLSPHVLWSGGEIRTVDGETRLMDTGFMEGSILPATPKKFPPPYPVRVADLVGEVACQVSAKRLQGVIVRFTGAFIVEVGEPRLYQTDVRGPEVRGVRFGDESGAIMDGVLLDSVTRPITPGDRFRSIRAIVHQRDFGSYEAIFELDEHFAA
jgi:hypothetical protein